MNTFDGVPCSKVLIRWRITWWSTPEPFDNEWIQVNHGHVVFVHLHHALSRNARRQRRDRRERSGLRHLARSQSQSLEVEVSCDRTQNG